MKTKKYLSIVFFSFFCTLPSVFWAMELEPFSSCDYSGSMEKNQEYLIASTKKELLRDKEIRKEYVSFIEDCLRKLEEEDCLKESKTDVVSRMYDLGKGLVDKRLGVRTGVSHDNFFELKVIDNKYINGLLKKFRNERRKILKVGLIAWQKDVKALGENYLYRKDRGINTDELVASFSSSLLKLFYLRKSACLPLKKPDIKDVFVICKKEVREAFEEKSRFEKLLLN